eukprot:scaffold45014_cov78-Cyclotella_meneghiniana.AAC.3
MKNKNVCRVCGANIDTSNGVAGLKNHLRLKHRRLYNLMEGIETDSKLNPTQVSTKKASTVVKTKNPDPSTFPQTRMKEHYPTVLSVADRKKQHLGRVTNWIIDTNQSFNVVGTRSFRIMFNTFSVQAPEITKAANRHSVRENVVQMGTFAKKATKMEVRKHKGSWTSDHWTSRAGVTFTTTTFHYVESWEMKSLVIDFRIFYGSTTGERLFEYQRKLLELDEGYHFAMFGVVDTTGNMGVLTQKLRGIQHETAFCTEHSFHLNAKIAFDDVNIPGAGDLMKKCRSLIEYFSKSTQASGELKRVQGIGMAKEYDGKNAVSVLQDVITRWWSTYRMLKRLHHLQPAFMLMVNNDTLDEDLLPTSSQWKILRQIELSLRTMAQFQRLLEGENYVTGSLVVIAVYKVRQSYMKILASTSAKSPVKALVRKLLDDFNQRFHPDVGAKLIYTGQADIGHGNRYTGIHPYLFIASMLDARVKNMLITMMTEAAFARLKGDLLVFMVEQKRQLMVSDLLDGEPPAPIQESEIVDDASNLSAIRDEDDDDLFGGLVANQDVEVEFQNENDAQLESVCLAELDMYLRDTGMPMHSDPEKKTLNLPMSDP